MNISEKIRFPLKRRVTATKGGKEMRTDAEVGVVGLQVMDEEIEGFPAG